MQHKHELESTLNRIETLTKKIKELEIECTTADAKTMEMANKNHELSKLLLKRQDQLNKKDQVRLYRLYCYNRIVNVCIYNIK